MNTTQALLLVSAAVLIACSPPTRDDPSDNGDTSTTCPAARVCGDGCCPAGQRCDAETHQCVTCQRSSCLLAHAECGKVPDGCGGELDCGGCAEGACGSNHLCPGSACVPLRCEDVHANCGDLADGCGHTLSCGTCSGEDSCGGGGVEHVCGHPAGPTCDASTRPTVQFVVKNGSADITSNPDVAVGTTVSLFTNATIPRGHGTYAWRLVKPADPSALVEGTSTASLITRSEGDYVVEVTVTDDTGCASAPATVTVHVHLNVTFRIELTWSQNYGDLDLHLLGPNGVFLDPVSDCYWKNCKDGQRSIDWGRNGTTTADGITTDDPLLVTDAMWGSGPEVIADDAPFEGNFTIIAYYYCARASAATSTGYSNVSSGPVTATVKVFMNDSVINTFTRVLTQRDEWKVASFSVRNAYVSVTPVDSVVKTTGYADACTADTF